MDLVRGTVGHFSTFSWQSGVWRKKVDRVHSEREADGIEREEIECVDTRRGRRRN